MAKANLTLTNGTTVVIEGEPEEVALLLAKVGGSPAAGKPRSNRGNNKSGASGQAKTPSRKGPQTLLRELVDEDWFKSKRTIGEVQKKLEEKGHIYPMENLSTPLLRMTRSRVLRRLKDNSGWVYVN